MTAYYYLSDFTNRDSGSLRSVAWRYVKCNAKAEDVVQDCLIKILTTDNTYANRKNFYSYLYRMVARAAIDVYRKDSKGDTILVADLSNVSYNRDESKEHLFEMIDSVTTPFSYRIVELRTQGLQFNQIADRLNVNENTVRSAFYRIRTKIKKKYKWQI